VDWRGLLGVARELCHRRVIEEPMTGVESAFSAWEVDPLRPGQPRTVRLVKRLAVRHLCQSALVCRSCSDFDSVVTRKVLRDLFVPNDPTRAFEIRRQCWPYAVLQNAEYRAVQRIRPCHASSTARGGIAQHPSLNGHAMPIKACAL
jgi:hypothetical protein